MKKVLCFGESLIHNKHLLDISYPHHVNTVIVILVTLGHCLKGHKPTFTNLDKKEGICYKNT